MLNNKIINYMDINLIQKYKANIDNFLSRTCQFSIVEIDKKIYFKNDSEIFQFNETKIYMDIFQENKLSLILRELITIIKEFDKTIDLDNIDSTKYNKLLKIIYDTKFKYINGYEFLLELKIYYLDNKIPNLLSENKELFHKKNKYKIIINQYKSSNIKIENEIIKMKNTIKMLKKENEQLKINSQNTLKKVDNEPGTIENKSNIPN